MIPLNTCHKQYTQDLDKALPPKVTIEKGEQTLSRFGKDLLLSVNRIDTGRLNIPVYISYCGSKAQKVMQTRKQMGKGASEEQARASALMELIERYSFFSFFEGAGLACSLSWSAAEKKLGHDLMSIETVLQAFEESIDLAKARQIMDLITWRFCPGFNISKQEKTYLPLDLFKKINEFNGSSAGNTFEESILQGANELIERHVGAIIERDQPNLPTLDPKSFTDPILVRLWHNLIQNNIRVWLKDLSLDTAIPTIGVLAFDPNTFPDTSEIIFTAGTATSPNKAAIRALTELAQLAGDFETGSSYEPSGLPKYQTVEETVWIQQGPLISIEDLPDISHNDILVELTHLTRKLEQKGYCLYSVDITHPELGIPANFNIIPGFLFRERTSNISLGLVVGRILAEEYSIDKACTGLNALSRIEPDKHYLPFFYGLLSLRMGEIQEAGQYFSRAEPLQPSPEEQGLVAFYMAYTLSQIQAWTECLPHLDRAIKLSPYVNSFHNLRGVANFKQNRFDQAAQDFHKALSLDGGSAIDLANLGLCYRYMGKLELACQYLQKSLSLDPNIDFAQRNLDELTKDNQS